MIQWASDWDAKIQRQVIQEIIIPISPQNKSEGSAFLTQVLSAGSGVTMETVFRAVAGGVDGVIGAAAICGLEKRGMENLSRPVIPTCQMQ